MTTPSAPDPGSAPNWDDAARIAGVDVDAVVAAVLQVPGVSGVGSSQPGGAATYLPGRRVLGVRVESDVLTVEITAQWGVSADELYGSVRRSLTRLSNGRHIDVVVTDIEVPGETSAQASPGNVGPTARAFSSAPNSSAESE